jgi:SAM-dependent methyltransferase
MVNFQGLRFPDDPSLSQDREWVEVQFDGDWRRIRLHDYDKIYEVPGLYESLFYRALQCNSPLRVVSLLRDAMAEASCDPSELRVLDVGAGNGMVGSELQNLAVETVVGIDIIEEAREATVRDRAWSYDDYLVADLTALDAIDEALLRSYALNALTCVAALGFGDIPAAAFLKAIDLISDDGWLAFNVKEAFVHERDESGFARLIRELSRDDAISIEAYVRYQHRLSCAGEPLHYIAMVARKTGPVPASIKARFGGAV